MHYMREGHEVSGAGSFMRYGKLRRSKAFESYSTALGRLGVSPW